MALIKQRIRPIEQYGAGGIGPPGAKDSLGAVFQIVSHPCELTLRVGDWVRVRPSDGLMTLAHAGNVDSADVVGVCEFKATNTLATVRIGGLVSDLFTTLEPGKLYFLGLDGSPTLTPPAAPGSVVVSLGRLMGNGQFLIQIGTRMVRS